MSLILAHTDAFTQRCTEQLLHTNAPRLLRTEVFTHKLYTEKPLHRASFKHRSIYTQKLYTHTHKSFTHTRLYTQSFYTQTLLRIEACSQSRVYTEQLLHTDAFKQREACAQSSLNNLTHTETLNTQMPKPLHRQVVTHRGIYAKVLHTDAADASTHKCFWTQMPFHTEAFTQIRLAYTRLYTQKLLDTECFSENHRSFDTEKHLRTEAFTQKLLHTEAFTHRTFYTQKLLHTEAYTLKSFYTQKLVHTEAFTHRSFYTEKPLHTDAFPQKNRFHRAAFTHFKKSQFYVSVWRSAIISCERVASGFGKSQFLTWDNHFAWKGRAWTCKIAILHKFYFARNACAWRFRMDKVAVLHHFLNVCIWR